VNVIFFQMDKRMALAISADDVSPEVAETCFGNMGPVDENDDSDDDSMDEVLEDKNSSKTEEKGLSIRRNSNVRLDSNQSSTLSHTTGTCR
jgi:hypothetical protein